MPRDRSEYNQRYYQENRERIVQKMKEYYQKNPEKKRAYMKAYLKSPEGQEEEKGIRSKILQKGRCQGKGQGAEAKDEGVV